MNRSTTLGWIDGSSAEERLELNIVQDGSGSVEFVMSEQHFADGIGWFTQRSLSLDPHQVAQLKRILLANELPKDRRKPVDPSLQPTLKLHSRPHSSEDVAPLADVG